VEILSGVSAGDRIVATNLGRLRVDSPVRILASRAEAGTAPASSSPASNAHR
jgi:hypothetical protein